MITVPWGGLMKQLMMKKNMMYGGKRTDRYLETGVRDKVRDVVR